MKHYFQQLDDWFNQRFPHKRIWRDHLADYYTPKNFNIWYFFGSLAILTLVIQILSGIFLVMFYIPDPAQAFSSVEYIMRDVKFGWLIRYIHSTGASAFFIVIYLHIFKALIYGSYRRPRELLWIFGVLLFLVLMAEAFMGYLLPWGQMSYWGAQVITSLYGAIPWVGDHLLLWLRGDFNIAGATLSRFFALHIVALPLVILVMVFFHITALHKVGSNNPDGIEIKNSLDANGKPLDGIPFHPYYTVKDLYGVAVFLIIFAAIIFFAPDMFGYFLEHSNFAPADPLKTPEYIAPVWYMTPYYAMLRAIPDRFGGVMIMQVSLIMWFFLPWLDKSPVKSIRYRGLLYKSILVIFTTSFLALFYLGITHVTPVRTWLARIGTVIYFAFFIFMPYFTRWDNVKTPPTRVTTK